MTEYKIGAATVRIHGEADRERIKAATEKFAKRVLIARQKQRKEAGK